MSKEKDQEQSMVFDPSFIEIGDGAQGEGSPPPGSREEPELNLFGENVLTPTEEEQKKEIVNKVPEEEGNDKTPPLEDIKDEGKEPTSTEGTKDAMFSVVLGQELIEEGVLSNFDEKEIAQIEQEQGRAAAMKRLLAVQAESTAKELQDAQDEGYKDYVTMIKGGVPKEEAAGFVQVEQFNEAIKQINLLGESDEEVQARKDVLTLNYRLNTQFSDEKIAKMVEKAYEEGSDIEELDEAKGNIDSYISNTKIESKRIAEQAETDAINAQQKQLDDLKIHIEKTDEYFKGEIVNKEIRTKITNNLTSQVQLQDGTITSPLWAERAKNPISFDTKVAYLQAIGYFEDKPLEKFIKNAETKSASNLQSFLNDDKGMSFKRSAGKSFGNEDSKKDQLGSALGI